jgi:Zn ribbon nucleic-acid-binding protein
MTKEHCIYLNEKTGRCTVYKNRFEKNPNCLTLQQMYRMGSMPRECPYVKDDPVYQTRDDIPYEDFDAFKRAFKGQLSEETWESIEKDYNSCNKPSEDRIITTIRTPFCPECNSHYIISHWEKKFNFLYLEYECQTCGHEWDMFKEQLKYTLKLLKKKGVRRG